MNKHILILGTQADVHVTSVAAALTEIGVEATLVDHFAATPIEVRMGSEGETIRVDGKLFSAETLCWSRAKILSPPFGTGDAFRNEYTQASGWRALMRNLTTLLGSRVVNSVSSVYRSSQKLEQLRTALRLGLAIPDTLVSNDADLVAAFCEHPAGAIIKTLDDPMIPHTDTHKTASLMTTLMDSKILRRDPEAIRVMPSLFQARVPKSHELRVCLHGAALFAFRIDSQARELSSVDWRYGAGAMNFEPVTLDDRVAAFCQAYLDAFDLFSGQFDFIVAPDGEVVFVECNPQGAWAWLDDIVEGQIARSVAAALAGRASAPGSV